MASAAPLRLRPVSWEEYGATLRVLHDKIRAYLDENGLTVSAVAPILRGGATAGAYLAYKLCLLTILPLQYKYFFREDAPPEIRRILSLPLPLPLSIPIERATILLVENNHCSGATAKAAAADLLAAAPGCSILYAAAYMDWSNQFVPGPGVRATFFGRLTNETGDLTADEAEALNIPAEPALFPWENEEEELAMIRHEKFEYG